MIAAASLLLVLFLSLIVVRVAAEALVLTGLSREAARFQARSAWTGTGFTTAESEQVVNHPVRRQIITTLMFLRSAGLVTAASTLMLSFVSVEARDEGFMRVGLLVAGVAALWFAARSDRIGHHLSRTISWALKRYTRLDTRDYAGLLHLAGEYAVLETRVEHDNWMAGRALRDLRLADEGVLVLGITRPGGKYVGAPRGDARISPGDIVVLYGRAPDIGALGRRRADEAGEHERRQAVEEESRTRNADGA